MTKVELYAIGTSTALESNKSQSHNAQAAGHAFSMRTGSVRTAVSPLQAAEGLQGWHHGHDTVGLLPLPDMPLSARDRGRAVTDGARP